MVLYSDYRPEDSEQITELLAETFTRHDPPAIALGLTPAEFRGFVRLLLPNALASRNTLVARSTNTGELVGALLAEDSAAALPEGLKHLSPKFGPIFDILGHLAADYPAGQHVAPGESLHLYLLGVSPAYAGRGIAQELVVRCLAKAQSNRYRVAVAEATNKTSQHIFRKLGFVERARVSYEDHRFEGRACFQAIVAHSGPILMEKRLASDLSASFPAEG
jgi:ribosomal protein S18 acetylase RimI-like enzyme